MNLKKLATFDALTTDYDNPMASKIFFGIIEA